MLRRLLNWLRNRYEAASFSTSRSWIDSPLQSARLDISNLTRQELQRKSRYFEQNNAIVNRMADLFESYTVGSGLVVEPASSDKEWNKKASDWWAGWCRYPDLTSLQSFGTLQGMAARSWFIDGEVFKVKTRGQSGRPRIQYVEGHRVATPPELRDDKSISDGVRINADGRPVGYFMAGEFSDPGVYLFVPMDSVRHLFEPSRPGQMRGIPFIHPVMNVLHDLDDLMILEMKAAKDAAEVSNVITNAAGELDPSTLRKQRFSQTTQDASGAAVSEARFKAIRDAIGGRTVALRTGETFEQFRSARPGVVTREYWKLLMEWVCVGTGFPYVIVFPDSMQGTVYRGALDMAAAWFRARHLVMADDARDSWEYVMQWARFAQPVDNLPDLRDAPGDWKNVIIHAPREVNVDVGRNSTAMLQELMAGATTYDAVYAPLGLSWRTAFLRLREQQQFAEDIGLKIQFPGQAQAPGEQKPDPEEVAK